MSVSSPRRPILLMAASRSIPKCGANEITTSNGRAHDINSPGGRPHVDGGIAAVEHERIVRFYEDRGIGLVSDLLLHLDANRRDLAARGGMERFTEQLLEPRSGNVPQRVFAECVDVLRR